VRLVVPAALLALAGCSWLIPTPERQPVREEGGTPGLTIAELDQLTKNFAHRYVQLVADACDRLKLRTGAPEVRREAHRLKLATGLAAFDMVTGPEPLFQLLNLATLVELEGLVWADGGRARRVFGGEEGEVLARALGSAREDSWGLVGQVLTADEIERFRGAIHAWRRRNPDVGEVEGVRFDVLVREEDETVVGLAGSIRALLGKFNPDDPGEKTATESRLLIAQAFFYGKQLPTLLTWQLEAALSDALGVVGSAPAAQAAEATLGTVARLAGRLEQLAEPAKEGGTALDATLREVRAVLEEAQDLSRAVGETVRAVKGPEPPAAPAPEGKPFDLEQARRAVRETAELVRETRGLAESPRARENLEEVVDLASRRLGREGRQLANLAAWRAAQLVLLVAAVVAAFKAAAYGLRRWRAAK
jgi:hypothetical protein